MSMRSAPENFPSPRAFGPVRRHRLAASAIAAATLALAAAPPAVEAQAPAATSPNRFRGEPVTLNFVNADIEAVSRAMGAILRQQFVVDPRVKGNITLYSETPLSPREAYLNYLASLRGLGFTVVESGGLFKVVPEADAKLQTGTVSVGNVNRQGDQIITQIFRINHENANNLVPVLRPLISPNNTINANPGNNTLVITDYADNLARIAKIIAAMDTPGAGEVEVVPLKYAVAADIAPLVQRLAADAGGGVAAAPGAVSSAPSILSESRSNSLIVRAGNVARMASIKDLIGKLDRPPPAGTPPGNIWVVYLRNADATKLAAVLRAAFTTQGQSGGGAGGPSSLLQPAAAPAPGGQGAASPQATAPVGASPQPSTGGFIQADPSTNSLIITAAEPLYRQLRAVIDQLDSRRAQVYIESMIVKVDANKLADIGVQWQGISGRRGDNTIVGAGTNFGSGTSNIVNLSAATVAGVAGVAQAVAAGVPGGLNVGVLRNIGGDYVLGALARFLQTNTDANVLSTPNLIALDNEEAKIVVGQNVPFVTGSFTNTGTGGGAVNPFQTIERRDVGLTLRVRPQIGEGGTVRMTIFQENSNVIQGTTGSAGPVTDKSSIETTIVVDDGQVMVLGGLLKDEYSGGQSKVPLLGDIPVLGALFRSENRNRGKSNLMVFLRPVVLRDQSRADALTIDRYDAIRARQVDVQPGTNPLFPINEAPIVSGSRPAAAPLAAPAAPAGANGTSPATPAPVLPGGAGPAPARPIPPALGVGEGPSPAPTN
jgi:general secretion pathway protein D